MTDLRTAAQQALEALEWCEPAGTVGRGGIEARKQAITTLRAALAQQAEPVQEPVAWIQPDHLQKARIAPFLCRVEPTQRCADFVPLYLAPPQRKPLTEEVATLTAQRDALLEALKDATKTIEHLGYPLAAIERARAAIKAVEETK